MAAEWIAAKKPLPRVFARSDKVTAWEFAYEIVPEADEDLMSPAVEAKAMALCDRWFDDAVGLLEMRWPAVQAVATSLVAQGSISRAELKAIVARAPAQGKSSSTAPRRRGAGLEDVAQRAERGPW